MILVLAHVIMLVVPPARASAVPHRVAVVPFLFDGQRAPYPISDIEAAVFGNGVANDGMSLANYVREDSMFINGLGGTESMEIDGDIIGEGNWIPTRSMARDRSGNCRDSRVAAGEWRTQIFAEIDESVLTGYDTVLFIGAHPCMDSDGLGGGGQAWALVPRLDRWWTLRTIAHEWHHAIGLQHSNQLRCRDTAGRPVAISTDCEVHGYDDPYSMMGDWRLKLNNGYHIAQLGYLPMSNISAPDRGADGSSVTIRLTPVHPMLRPVLTTRGLPNLPYITVDPRYQMIQIDRCRWVICYNVPDGRRFLYLEFRQPYGVFDRALASDEDFDESSEVARGLTVRLGPDYSGPQGGESLVLVDTDPGTPGTEGTRADHLDAPLDPDNILEDPSGAVAIAHAGSGVEPYGTTTTRYIDVRITWLPFTRPFLIPLPNLRLPCFVPGTLVPCPFPGPGPVLPGPLLPTPISLS